MRKIALPIDSGSLGFSSSGAAAYAALHIAGLVHVALDTGIRWKLIKVNPVDGVQLPKVRKREAKVLEAKDLSTFVKAVQAHGLYEFVIIACATGARRGELCGLTWSDIDFVGRSMKVSKSLEQTREGLRVKGTKTEKPREIALPSIAIEVLRAHRAAQSENRRMFGSDYRDDLNLVFATPEGNYWKPDSITSKVCFLAKKAGLSASLHTLRHSHGSQLLSAGVPLPAVSKRLGHSSVYVTATVYAHTFSKDEVAAASSWDDFAKAAKLS